MMSNKTRTLISASVAIAWCVAIGSARPQQRLPPAAPTFNKDVAPILYKNCTTCHRAGEVAPFALMTFADAQKHADEIVRVTEAREMPPWKAEHGDLVFSNERRLSDEQIATLRAWFDAGAPEGDAKDKTSPPVFADGWLAGQPDATLTPEASFTVPADGDDVFRCFVVPVNLQRDVFVSGLEFRPGNRRVVHHALVFLDADHEARAVAKGRSDYPCFGGPGIRNARMIGGWAPGTVPTPRRPDFAIPVPAGSDVIVQIHYHPTGQPEQDRFTLGLGLSGPPSRGRTTLIVFNPRIDIPAGATNHVIRASLTLPRDVEILGFAPHAHYLCRQMTLTAAMPDGTVKRLLRIADWDFHWQGGYQLATPLKLQKGTRLEFEYVYDNSPDNEHNPSSPPVRVKWGEQTKDEMALAFFIVALPTPADVKPFEDELNDQYMSMIFAPGTRLENLPADLTPTERQGLTLAFNLFDKDKDGALDADEAAALLKFLKSRK